MKKKVFAEIAILSVALILCGCGVKGKPLPPLVSSPIGRGEPSFSKITEKIKIQKTGKKIQDDFEDESDFKSSDPEAEPQ